MKFCLNLLSFLLITFGGFFFLGSINDDCKPPKESTPQEYKLFYKLKRKLMLASLFSVLLGIGIIVARIFS